MLEIVRMMARCLIWNGADLDRESDCIETLCKCGFFNRKAVKKYIDRAIKLAEEMENDD